MTQQKKNPKIIYAKKGRLIDNGSQKILRLFNGKVINQENLKINTFEFKISIALFSILLASKPAYLYIISGLS